MILRPCGQQAILVELADAEQRRRVDAALRSAAIPGILEHVPAAVTVLVRVKPSADLARVAESLRALPVAAPADRPASSALLVVPTIYGGPDLVDVATHLEITPEQVIDRHTKQVWSVDFCGFTPGFAYLVGSVGGLDVPRRATPRTRVPRGAVGVAGPYSGIYPRASPGGWQVLGRTEVVLWDQRRDPPALLGPGDQVRFEAV